MPFWVVMLIIIIIGIFNSCMPSKTATFEVTPKEFINEYNSSISNDLTVRTFKEGIVASVDESNLSGNLNKYTFSYSYDSKSGKMKTLRIKYNFGLEPEGLPTKAGMEKMERICLLAISIIDDGFFTNGSGILKNLGFYSNQDGRRSYSKNNIKYTFNQASSVNAVQSPGSTLSMEAEKD